MSQGMLGNSDSLRRIVSGPVADLLVKLNGPDGAAYESALNKILRREDVAWKPPLTFVKNEHGHYRLEFEGFDLTGEQEIERLAAAGYNIGDWARSCLTSAKPDGYDAVHRLIAGQRYKVALMPHTVIKRDSDRTTANLRKKASEFGYQQPLAGIVPRICETVSDEEMGQMGFIYIVALHAPITDSGGNPYVLLARRGGRGRWLGASWGRPDDYWDDRGASAFLVAS